MQRGRPLIVWGLALGLAGLWLAWRWPGIVQQRQRLALAMAGPALAAVAPAPLPPALPPALRLAQASARGAAVAVAGAALPPPGIARPIPAAPIVPASIVPDIAGMILPPAVRAEPIAAAPVQPPPQPPLQPPPQLQPPLPPPGFRLAEAAYARLAAGQRRQAAALFDAALAMAPGNRQWQADRAALGRRWQLGGFALLRDGGPATDTAGVAASPVLGGGQIGASLAVLADPYARRPLALVVRANVAAGPGGVQGDSAQAAIGLRQMLLPGMTVSAERLIGLGRAAGSDWTLRLAGGGRWWRFSGYGEAGVLGNGEAYAGVQGSARLLRLGPAALAAGSWASVQTGAPDVWRVDVGPSIAADWRGLRLQADWRQRVGGNAAPGSGPVITLSAGF